MDDSRFDALARVLGGRGTRRGTLAAALAILAGRSAAGGGSAQEISPRIADIGGTFAAEEACLRPNASCDNDATLWYRPDSCKKCCSGYPEPSGGGWKCGCTPKGGGCSDSAACCDNRDCYYGVCGGPDCMPEGGECSGDIPCCAGLLCDSYGWCRIDPNYSPEPRADRPECRPAGRGCTLPEQCCSGVCGEDGRCAE